MAQDIVSGLFGLSPSQVAQQQQQQINLQAQNYAQQDPFQRATQGMYQAGAGLGQIGAGMLGMVNPEVEAAKQREATLGQIDMTTPEGILKGAELARQRGDVRMQIQLQQLAEQRKAEIVDSEFKAAQAAAQRASMNKPAAPSSSLGKLLSDRAQAAAMGDTEAVKAYDAMIRKDTMIKTATTGVAGKKVTKKEAENTAKQKESNTVVESALRTTLDAAQSLIDHPGRTTATGKSALFNPLQYGTDAADFLAELESFKAKTFVPMVSQLKGMGALSDAEGKKLTAAVGALDEKMSETGFKSSLQKILNELNLAYKNKTGNVWTPTTTTTMQESAGVIKPSIEHPVDIQAIINRHKGK